MIMFVVVEERDIVARGTAAIVVGAYFLPSANVGISGRGD